LIECRRVVIGDGRRIEGAPTARQKAVRTQGGKRFLMMIGCDASKLQYNEYGTPV
jgi:hypothetical protein